MKTDRLGLRHLRGGGEAHVCIEPKGQQADGLSFPCGAGRKRRKGKGGKSGTNTKGHGKGSHPRKSEKIYSGQRRRRSERWGARRPQVGVAAKKTEPLHWEWRGGGGWVAARDF